MQKTFNKILACFLGAVALMVVSCNNDTYADRDRGATPEIAYARLCDLDKSDSLIVRASLGTHLCFVGNNLGDVQQVWFNDQKCKLNPTLVTSHTIICDIPSVIPGEVSNNVRFITSTGIEANFPFEVVVPGPVVETMSLEYAPAGSTVTLTGSYFVDDPNVPMTVVFTGGAKAQIKSIEQEKVEIVIPAGAKPGPLTVSTIYGTTETALHYMDQRGMMFEFDGVTGLTNHGWHNAVIETDENAISGNFMRLGDPSITLPGKDAWDDGHFAFEYWAGSWNTPTDYPEREGIRLIDIVDFSKWKDMSIKFELCVPSANPWQSCAMQIIFAGTNLVSMGNPGTDIYGNTVAGCNNTFFQESANPGYPRILYRPWTATQPFHTADQWITVSIPLTQAAYDFNGGNATQGLTPECFSSFTIFVVGGGVEGVDCNPVIKLDNIRVVPTK